MDRSKLQDEALAAACAADVMREAGAGALQAQGVEPTPGRLAFAALCLAACEARRAGMSLSTWHVLVRWIRSSL